MSLVFSPHLLRFSILFYILVFEAPDLKSMEGLQRLHIKDGQQEMLLPLKREMGNYYVFPTIALVDS